MAGSDVSILDWEMEEAWIEMGLGPSSPAPDAPDLELPAAVAAPTPPEHLPPVAVAAIIEAVAARTDAPTAAPSAASPDPSPTPQRPLPEHYGLQCWRCGGNNHVRSSCRRPAVLFCSGCGRRGVLSRDCCRGPRYLPRARETVPMVDRATQCDLPPPVLHHCRCCCGVRMRRGTYRPATSPYHGRPATR